MSASLAMPHSNGQRSGRAARVSKRDGRDASAQRGARSQREGKIAARCVVRDMVGTGRFELPTCRLGGDRSIHLSYVPTVFLLYRLSAFDKNYGGELAA